MTITILIITLCGCSVKRHPSILVIDSDTKDTLRNVTVTLLNPLALNMRIMPQPGAPRKEWAKTWYLVEDSTGLYMLEGFDDWEFKRKFRVKVEKEGYKSVTKRVEGTVTIELKKRE